MVTTVPRYYGNKFRLLCFLASFAPCFRWQILTFFKSRSEHSLATVSKPEASRQPPSPFGSYFFPKPPKVQIPIANAGSIDSYSPARVRVPHYHIMDLMHSISANSRYSVFSFEELRVADYEHGRRFNRNRGTNGTQSGALIGVNPQPASNNTINSNTAPSANLFGRVGSYQPGAGSSSATAPNGNTNSTTIPSTGLLGNFASLQPGASSSSAAPSTNNVTAAAVPAHQFSPWRPTSGPVYQPTPIQSAAATSPTQPILTDQPSISFIYQPNAELPPGMVLKTIESKPACPKSPSEFGFFPTIKYSNSASGFIKGIPRSVPSDYQSFNPEEYQLTILKLCILAERICWDRLFSDARAAYTQGELNLRRVVTAEHINLIYANTYPDSKLRVYVMESIRSMRAEGQNLIPYLEMAHQYDDFLADLFAQVMGSRDPSVSSATDGFNSGPVRLASRIPISLSQSRFDLPDESLEPDIL
jgi:hypothetical protein